MNKTYQEKIKSQSTEALKIIFKEQKATSAVLQIHMEIGYANAAGILDYLAEIGLIGISRGAKLREVFLIKIKEHLQIKNDKR